MKKDWKTLAFCILIPLAVGTVAGLLSMGGMENFMTMNQPPLSPPAWVFPVAWTILYTLMGISSYLIYVSESGIPQNGNSNISVSKNTKENNGKSKSNISEIKWFYSQILLLRITEYASVDFRFRMLAPYAPIKYSFG